MLAALLGVSHALMHTEMPVHVRRLLAPAVVVCSKTPTTLRARRTEVIV